jgi:hypothetical protein
MVKRRKKFWMQSIYTSTDMSDTISICMYVFLEPSQCQVCESQIYFHIFQKECVSRYFQRHLSVGFKTSYVSNTHSY